MTSIKKAVAALALGAAAALAQTLGFHFYGPASRFVTPWNGTTGHSAVFCFDNPNNSGVNGQVFNLLGGQVATFISGSPGTDIPSGASLPPGAKAACSQSGVLPNSMKFASWDGTTNGSFAHSGLYIYRIQAEGGTYTGSLVVVR